MSPELFGARCSATWSWDSSASSAFAAPGDIHRVSGQDVVNLRAGPTDASNIRGKVDQGDEVIELTREGNWIGVRVLQTGEEGWVYGGLLERVAQSGLLPRDAAARNDGDAGFLQLWKASTG